MNKMLKVWTALMVTGVIILSALILQSCFAKAPVGGTTGIYLHLEEKWAKSVLPSVPGGLEVFRKASRLYDDFEPRYSLPRR